MKNFYNLLKNNFSINCLRSLGPIQHNFMPSRILNIDLSSMRRWLRAKILRQKYFPVKLKYDNHLPNSHSSLLMNSLHESNTNASLNHICQRRYYSLTSLNRREWYSDDHYKSRKSNNDDKPPTVEKQLLNYMSLWKMDEAVELLVATLKAGQTPNSGVILNLLQQLAYMGEVNNILELHEEFLKSRNVTREVKFYSLLTDAYRNSGRVEEGIAMLRITYHKIRDFSSVDPFFTMVTIMTINHFEHRFDLIEEFVSDLTESDPPVPKVVASLWKCLVATEKFSKADALLTEHESLLKMVPSQVSELVYAPFYITYNKDIVLDWLLHNDSLSLKGALKSVVLEALIEHKCENNAWQEAMECLTEAMGHPQPYVKPSTLKLFLSKFMEHLTPSQIEKLENSLEALEDLDLSETDNDEDEKKEP